MRLLDEGIQKLSPKKTQLKTLPSGVAHRIKIPSSFGSPANLPSFLVGWVNIAEVCLVKFYQEMSIPISTTKNPLPAKITWQWTARDIKPDQRAQKIGYLWQDC